MRAAWWTVLGLVTLTPLGAQSIPAAEYRERRAELRKSVDGVMVLMGAADPVDLHDAFYQEPNFAYLTGWQEPGAALLLTSKAEMLFLPTKAGFHKVFARASLEAQFLRTAESAETIFTLEGDQQARELARLVPLHP